MRLILEVISGPFQGKQIEAKVGEKVRIGRTTKADVAMEDNFMSGEHFAIECNMRSCRVRDLNSRNGTQLNGKMISESYLTDGDQVHAGRTDFKVRIEDLLKTVEVSPAEQEAMRSELAKPATPPPPKRRQSKKLPPVSIPETPPSSATSPDRSTAPQEGVRVPAAHTDRELDDERPAQQARQGEASEPVVQAKSGVKPALPSRTPASSPAPPVDVSQKALESYEAATPEGRLIHILSSQPGSLMALVDAIHDGTVLELLHGSTETFHSLYRNQQNAAIAPYLVALPPRSELLKLMVQQGWGHEWGVYLTCPLSLLELREFFRTSLMVTMPDGVELFSRFYDPRFFRSFLETCSAPEADKFFGPVTSYFMEDERPEILLQFRRSKRGAEKKGHLLSVL